MKIVPLFRLACATIALAEVTWAAELRPATERAYQEYIASLQLMLTRAPTTLLPAHGPAISDGHGKLREGLVQCAAFVADRE